MITRIAPSPTGKMHIGTARTAYFNWLAARSVGGQFILRIDDTDMDRSATEHVDVILETFDLLGMDYDQIHYQSKRMDVYLDTIERLEKDGRIARKDGAVFLTTSFFQNYWKDELSGNIPISDSDKQHMSEMVLIKSDGSPTYNFASAVDDIEMGITDVIRGVDHISNTPKQLLLYEALGKQPPNYFHVGLILGPDGKKLSKRHGAACVADYICGDNPICCPEALMNLLLRMGWGPYEDNKANAVIPVDKALSMFWTGGKMRSAPSKLDMAKLAWYNKKYVR